MKMKCEEFLTAEQFEVGQRIGVRFDAERHAADIASGNFHPADQTERVFSLMMITGVGGAEAHQRCSAIRFSVVRLALGRDADKVRVLWLADETRGFEAEGVNGFPALLLPQGEVIGLDGIYLKLRILEDS